MVAKVRNGFECRDSDQLQRLGHRAKLNSARVNIQIILAGLSLAEQNLISPYDPRYPDPSPVQFGGLD